MSSIFGENIKVSIFGESHGPAIGGVIDGIEPGFKIDFKGLDKFLQRRRPGQSKYSSSRKEADRPIFLSGLKEDVTTGTPLAFVIENKDQRSKDYDQIKNIPRPGHGDYPAFVKYKGYEDQRGGGHFSGRLTASICVAGGIVLQILEEKEIHISSKIKSIKGNERDPYLEIEKAIAMEDSVGGIVTCKISGLDPGLGGPKMASIESRLAGMYFAAIPAVKGIEFGKGFEATMLYGSEHNDPYRIEDGDLVIKSNNSGGVLGGISTGQDIVFNLAIKPTPSIARTQKSVNLDSMENVDLKIQGRHDPCIVPRALVVVEAVAGLTIYDILKD